MKYDRCFCIDWNGDIMDKLWVWISLVMVTAGFFSGVYFLSDKSNKNETANEPAYVVIETMPMTETTFTETTLRKETTTAVTSAENVCTTEEITELTEEVFSVSFPLNLNTATIEELMELPGIGEVTAGNIISYRDSIGGFLNRSQLLEVYVIGDAKYNEIYDYTTLLVKLHTGRTHQIRVHMSHIGHPLLGDELYGGKKDLITRQALHCYKLSFTHPITGRNIQIECDLPEDMEKLNV